MRLYAIVLCATAFFTARSIRAADANMSQQEREQVIQLLKDSQKEFLQAVSNLSDEQWKWKPTPERWSVGEVAEHIMLSESALFSRMQAALKTPPNPDWEKKTEGKTEFLLRVMAQRLGKAQAPEEIQPQGKLSRAEIMTGFAEVRARTLIFAEETTIALKEHTSEHPFPVFNTLNAYQWLLYIPLHNMRHDKQIEEVKATAGFPK
jgi:uncharacterized damage-inducible protein DinB